MNDMMLRHLNPIHHSDSACATGEMINLPASFQADKRPIKQMADRWHPRH
jgi:hypothetical protein